MLLPLLLLAVTLSACGRGEVVRPVTVTPYVPPNAATSTARAAQAAAATEAPVAVAQGDAAAGEALFTEMQASVGFACSTCHNAASSARLIGPGLQGIGATAATRVEGQSASDYLHTAIVDPNSFIVPPDDGGPYPENLMPQTYATLFSEQQINDLVAYLMTL